MRLKDKVALITGGASGIGEGTAMRFAEEGAAVAVIDLNGEAANRVVEKIKAKGGKAIAIQSDVIQVANIERAVAETVKAFSTIHILLAAAGMFKPSPIEDTTEEFWDRCLDLDLRSVFFTIKAVTPIMKRQKYGKIITIR